MLVFITLSALVSQSLATNSTTVEGWQFDDDSRSSWDILWGCLSTTLACTWTALHQDVPPRNISTFRAASSKSWNFLLILLAPEMIAWMAAQELWAARSAVASFNSCQATRDHQTKEPISMSRKRAPALRQDEGYAVTLHPANTEWTLAQCFCFQMGGIALQTIDDWTYIVYPIFAGSLIEAGIIRYSDFRDRDVQDRAKADSFAKAFTVLQSTWTLVNILSRVAYHLPISLIELSTMAYVACGLLIYACWWHKPKDMTTPIAVYIPYNRNDIPEELRVITDRRPQNWVHLRVKPPDENILSSRKIVSQGYRTRVKEERSRAPLGGGIPRFELGEEMALDAFGTLIALSFCGIHLAAWNFVFPTQAERIAWRVFSLVAIVMVLAEYVIGQIPLVARWLEDKISLPPYIKSLADPNSVHKSIEMKSKGVVEGTYGLVRLGTFALIIASLRALPAGSYKSNRIYAGVNHGSRNLKTQSNINMIFNDLHTIVQTADYMKANPYAFV